MKQAEIPEETLNVRTLWIKAIGDCREAFSNFTVMWDKFDSYSSAVRHCIHRVDALISVLVDHGEAIVYSDVIKWKSKYFDNEHNEIWKNYHDAKKQLEEKDDYLPRRHKISFTGFQSEGEITLDELNEKCWEKDFNLAKELFEYIVFTINKYGMLFQEQPKGYTNVEMIGI